jgi:hypothetical protein
VVKADGKPYTVFTPYAKAWKNKCAQTHIVIHDTDNLKNHFYQTSEYYFPSLLDIGFQHSHIKVAPPDVNTSLICKIIIRETSLQFMAHHDWVCIFVSEPLVFLIWLSKS